MKQLIARTLLFLVSGTAPCALAAQTAAPTQADMASLPGPTKVVDMLATRLSLSDEQKAQIAPIITGRQQKLRALMADSSSRPFQKKREAGKIRDDSDKQIKAILTPDQWNQYTALEAQMQQQMKERMQEKKSGGS